MCSKWRLKQETARFERVGMHVQLTLKLGRAFRIADSGEFEMDGHGVSAWSTHVIFKLNWTCIPMCSKWCVKQKTARFEHIGIHVHLILKLGPAARSVDWGEFETDGHAVSAWCTHATH